MPVTRDEVGSVGRYKVASPVNWEISRDLRDHWSKFLGKSMVQT